MATALDDQFAILGKLGTLVVALGGKVGEAGQHIQFRQHRRCLADAPRLVRHQAPGGEEQVALEGVASLLRVKDLRFQFLQLRRGEPFGIHERLLAFVIRRSKVQIGLRDFDVIAEDTVEADFQRRDAGAFALAGFDLGQQLFAVLAQAAEFVELRIVAGPDQPTLAEKHRGLGMDRFLEQLAHVSKLVQVFPKFLEASCLEMVEISAKIRENLERVL